MRYLGLDLRRDRRDLDALCLLAIPQEYHKSIHSTKPSSMQREQIRNSYLEITDRLSTYYADKGEYSATIALCQKILAQDNCFEAAHRRLMQSYLALGQRHLAVRQYHTCTQTLKAELDIAPSEEIESLYRQIVTSSK